MKREEEGGDKRNDLGRAVGLGLCGGEVDLAT